jgi:signal transduction histidine kinase
MSPFGGRPRGVRARLLLIVVVAVAAALALMTLGFNLLLSQALSRDADALARSRAAAEAGSLNVVNGRVLRPAVPDAGGLDSEAWLFVSGVAVERPAVSRALDRAALGAVATPGRIIAVPKERARLYARAAVVDGRRVATVVAGVSLRPYLTTRQAALIGSLALALGLLLVVALVTRWVLAAALRPVARMTADAEAWSTSDADRRFAAGEPHDELGQLAATLDSLLDRLSASLRREQRFTAELSHELRTPLAKVCTEAELALRRQREPGAYEEALKMVLGNAQAMTRTIDTLVTAQRQGAGLARGRADATAVLREVAVACDDMAVERGIELAVCPPATNVMVGVEAEVAQRIVQPVVENACQYAAGQVTLGVGRRGSEIEITVDDDGPGVLQGELESIFEPGVRGSAGNDARARRGAGLGLALSRRLAQAASGDVTAAAHDGGGRFVVHLPAG